MSLETIPLLKWTHIALVYTDGEGVELYINGKLVAKHPTSGKLDSYLEGDILIGRTQEKMSPAYTERKTSTMEKTWMRYKGLMEELKIIGKALSIDEINDSASRQMKKIEMMDFPQFPGADIPTGAFGAFYTRLRYTSDWEKLWRVGDYSDVVVRFPNNPIKYIFWRGTGYIPAVVTENNIWMTDQSVENFSTGECYEAMGDKQCRYSHVRILESTPARCIIHWRYALANINHQIYAEDETGWGNWVDEYWTIYPDGIAVRKQVLHSPEYVASPNGFQFQETIFFNQPGTRPQDNVHIDAISFCDMKGNVATYSWEQGPPDKFDKTMFEPIQCVNLKSKFKPFSIFHPKRIAKPFLFGWVENYSIFPCWNHWPVSQIKSDGRNATASDRPSHSSLTETVGKSQVVEYGPGNTVIARQILGMTTAPIESLLPLAKSWNYAAELKLQGNDYRYLGYDVYLRAYCIERINTCNKPLVFNICATSDSPICNIAFEVKQWNSSDAAIKLNGKYLEEGRDYFLGYVPMLEGNKLIVWIYHSGSDRVEICVE
ncbi:LamG-like jellyroll fold domain-containing protein [Bacteroides uniformis]|uniref:LamG-like jellyroll fold domain-containing protein n=1 Tax=Bacteroides uniformis TaxID=820 RepID=UPI003512A03F